MVLRRIGNGLTIVGVWHDIDMRHCFNGLVAVSHALGQPRLEKVHCKALAHGDTSLSHGLPVESVDFAPGSQFFLEHNWVKLVLGAHDHIEDGDADGHATHNHAHEQQRLRL